MLAFAIVFWGACSGEVDGPNASGTVDCFSAGNGRWPGGYGRKAYGGPGPGDGYWGAWAWQIASVDADKRRIHFGSGGSQTTRGALNAGPWYVEGIREELTAKGKPQCQKGKRFVRSFFLFFQIAWRPRRLTCTWPGPFLLSPLYLRSPLLPFRAKSDRCACHRRMGTFQGGAKGVPLPELHGGGRWVGRRHGCRGRIARAAPSCQVRWTWAWLSGAFCCVYCAFLYVCCVLQAVATLEGNSVGIAQVVPTKGCLGDKPVPATMLTTHFGLAGGARATRWLTCPLPASSFGTRLRITPGPTPPAAAATFARRERRRSLSRAPRASLCATFPPLFSFSFS